MTVLRSILKRLPYISRLRTERDGYERAFQTIGGDSAPEGRPWTLHEAGGTGTVTIAGFEALLEQYGVGATPEVRTPSNAVTNVGESEPRPIRWPLRKPIYLP